MPPKYDLGRRAARTAATRDKILEATIAPHRERGIAATRYKDIARRADVGLGTVYHHFSRLDDLVAACGGRVMAMSVPPSPSVLSRLGSRAARIERLVAEVFGWYERDSQ